MMIKMSQRYIKKISRVSRGMRGVRSNCRLLSSFELHVIITVSYSPTTIPFPDLSRLVIHDDGSAAGSEYEFPPRLSFTSTAVGNSSDPIGKHIAAHYQSIGATESSLCTAGPLDSVALGTAYVRLPAVPLSLKFAVPHPIGDVVDILYIGRGIACFAGEHREEHGLQTAARERVREVDIFGVVIIRAVVLRVVEIEFLSGEVDVRGIMIESEGIDGIEGLGVELDREVKALVLGNGSRGVNRHAESEDGAGEGAREEEHCNDNEEIHHDCNCW